VSPSPGARSLGLYLTAFALMLAAGIALLTAARGFLESTRLLWCSAGLSAAAIVVSVVTILWRPRER
jgi:hypothetical protein